MGKVALIGSSHRRNKKPIRRPVGWEFRIQVERCSGLLFRGRLGSIFARLSETQAGRQMVHRSEMQRIVDGLKSEEARIGAYPLRDPDSVWQAIRGFFTRQAEAAGAA